MGTSVHGSGPAQVVSGLVPGMWPSWPNSFQPPGHDLSVVSVVSVVAEGDAVVATGGELAERKTKPTGSSRRGSC